LSTPWPFQDPPSAQVFADATILRERQPIHFLSHDQEGVWRFHDLDASYESVLAALPVNLSVVLELDPSLRAVADLAPGWVAFRLAVGDEWVRLRPNTPSPGNWKEVLAMPEILRFHAASGDLVFRSVNPAWWRGEVVIKGQRIMLGCDAPKGLLSSLKNALSSPLETKWKHEGLDLGLCLAFSDPYGAAYPADSDGKRLLMFQDVKAVFFATLFLERHERQQWLASTEKAIEAHGQ